MSEEKGLVFKIVNFLSGDHDSHPEVGEDKKSPISKHGFFEDIKNTFNHDLNDLHTEGNDAHFHLPVENITLESVIPIAQRHGLEIKPAKLAR